jgi:protein-tyrosine-phosphatase
VPTSEASVTEILLLCTANVCRSVMARGMLSARLAARGVTVPVASAGLLASGRPPG